MSPLLAILLLAPDYSDIYGLVAIVPCAFLTLFAAILTLLFFITKHLACFIAFLILELINLSLLLFVAKIDLGEFVLPMQLFSAVLFMLNVIILITRKPKLQE